MPHVLESASNATVVTDALVLLGLGLVLLLVGLRLRPPRPVEPPPLVVPGKPAPRPAPPPRGYSIVKTDKEEPADPRTVVVGAPAEWGGVGPIAVPVDGGAPPAARRGRLAPALLSVGAVVLVLGLLVGALAVQRLLEKPPSDVDVSLPRVLLGQPRTAGALPDKGLLDRAGSTHDQRSAAAYRGGLRVLAERVTVSDPGAIVRKYDDLGKGFSVPAGPLGGAAACYPVTTPGFVCVLVSRSSVVVVFDDGRRTVASAAARARVVRGAVVTRR